MRRWRASRAWREPLVVVNIGGVAQVTYISGDTVLAFDTGPGNAPIDDWMQRHTGKPVDQDGALRAQRPGRSIAALAAMLANPFFARLPPKSLDRMDFGIDAVEGLSPADGAATLTAFTAASIARAREHFPQAAATWIVSGGGRHNRFLMEELQGPCERAGAERGRGGLGRRCAGSAKALPIWRCGRSKGLPLSLPTTTGVKQPMTGGKFWKA